MTTTRVAKTEITADPLVPVIRITRDFTASVAQLMKAHLDPELYARWVGPANISTRILYWEASRGGKWSFGHDDHTFYGSFHDISEDRIVQTFTWGGQPEGVSLETLWFEDLGNGVTRLHAQSLVDSFESRDAWLASGMETGVDDGYAELDQLLADGDV